MYGDTKGKWLYDIYLDNHIVGNQGDYAFNSKKEAEIDANDYIENGLSKFYETDEDKFEIDYYQAQY